LRHPNSKKISRVFCEILSPKNSFRKTESALVPPPARILGGQNPKKKNVLSILEKITPAKIRKSKEHFFFLGLPSEARRWWGFRGAYDLVESHHARGACHISSRKKFVQRIQLHHNFKLCTNFLPKEAERLKWEEMSRSAVIHTPPQNVWENSMLRMRSLCDHKLLNFLFLKITKNVSTCRPRLAHFLC